MILAYPIADHITVIQQLKGKVFIELSFENCPAFAIKLTNPTLDQILVNMPKDPPGNSGRFTIENKSMQSASRVIQGLLRDGKKPNQFTATEIHGRRYFVGMVL